MKKSLNFLNNYEDGQILVLVGLMLFALVGFAALLTDGGMMQLNKRQLQAAADAAALAGANFLPFRPDAAIVTAGDYVLENDLLASNIKAINTPYGGDVKKIEVVLEQPASFTFGRIFNPSETMITARAVAMRYPGWAGEALPFINLDDNYGVDKKIELPGDKEKIIYTDFEIHNEDICELIYFTVDYSDGVEITQEKVDPQKQEVDCVYEQGYPIFLVSLRSTVIKSGEVKLDNGDGTFSYRSLENLKNNVIALDQLVLLYCHWDTNGFPESLSLTVLDVYDIGEGEFPEDYYNPVGGLSNLVE